ncbi:MAG: hypothetical protein ABWX82_14305 [Leifsonia sp.]
MRHDDIAVSLLLALDRHDELALAAIIHPDVRMVVDSGDQTGGDLRGRTQVGRALQELTAAHPDAALETVNVNGGPGLALRRGGGEVVGVLGIDLDGAAIGQVWLCTAPGKLGSWNPGPRLP